VPKHQSAEHHAWKTTASESRSRRGESDVYAFGDGQLRRATLTCSAADPRAQHLTLHFPLRATSAGLPTRRRHASATVTGFSSGAAVFYMLTQQSTNIDGKEPVRAGNSSYQRTPLQNLCAQRGVALQRQARTSIRAVTRVSGATSGTVWSIPSLVASQPDAGFKVFLRYWIRCVRRLGFVQPRTRIRRTAQRQLGTLSWTADKPPIRPFSSRLQASITSTAIQLCGPDGTPQRSSAMRIAGAFNGSRYLKYQASSALRQHCHRKPGMM